MAAWLSGSLCRPPAGLPARLGWPPVERISTFTYYTLVLLVSEIIRLIVEFIDLTSTIFWANATVRQTMLRNNITIQY
jgi:hypothetical protein